jgi:hypothetical protein
MSHTKSKNNDSLKKYNQRDTLPQVYEKINNKFFTRKCKACNRFYNSEI